MTAGPAVNLISWGGACASAGTAPTCTVTMDAAKTVSASFQDTPLISGLPTALTFALQNVGSTSATQSVTLTNSGTAALTIASIAASGDFGVTHSCGIGLGSGGFCTLSVSFSPSASGTRTGSVAITSNAPGSPHSMALSGSGQGSTSVVSASSLSFASQGVGSTSAVQTVTLSNTGGLVLNIASIVASGDFAVSSTTCGATLLQASSCGISVQFAPTVAGARSGNLVITNDGIGSPSTISLTGTGVAVPGVTLSLTSLSFPIQTVGASSAAQTITLTNTGEATLNLTSIVASGDFAVTNNCGSGLGVGGACNLSVIFTPTASGTRTGAITVTSNAPGSPHSVSLSGGSGIATQTILFGIAPRVVAGGTGTVDAAASSGLDVLFSSLTTSTCTVSGSTVTGITAGTCTIAANQTGNGTYNAAPQVTQNIAVATATSTRLINLSTRGQVQTGDNVMIGGFIIGGSTPKKVLIRAVGPNLANFGVSGVLLDPSLQLFTGQTPIASNDNWGAAINHADITATGLAPAHALESAILTTLSPGEYTAIVSGNSGGTGVGIVEVYEVDNPGAPFTNNSTRGKVLTGDNVMIGGFIIQGDSAKTVLIRAVGPNLANYGVTGVLANPKLQLYSGQTVIASNDDWGTSTNASAITATGLAPVNPLESAILITLQPGAYTAIVSGADGGSGVGIVEVFAQ